VLGVGKSEDMLSYRNSLGFNLQQGVITPEHGIVVVKRNSLLKEKIAVNLFLVMLW